MTRRDWFLFAGLMIAVTMIALPILTYPPGRDQGEFATIARGLLEGRTPYTDLWNPKPPAIFYVYALAIQLFGPTTTALRTLDLFAVPVICAALYWLGTRIGNRRVGLFTAAIFPAFYFTESFWTLTQNDGLVLLPMTLAVAVAVKAADNGWLWAFGAGALTAFVAWFKYPFMLFGLVVIGAYFLIPAPVGTSLPSRSKSKVKHLLAFVAGGALIIIGGILYLAATGALDELLLSAQVTSQYTALTFNPTDFVNLMRTALGFRWQQWGLLWLLVAVWFAIGRFGQQRKHGWWLVMLWAFIGLVIMLVQAKGYDYHWLPMLPALALLAADTLDRLLRLAAHYWNLTSQSQIASSRLVLLLFLLIQWQGIWPRSWHYLTGAEDQLAYFGRFQAGEFVADESLEVSNYLRERVATGDSLYIWGFRPEVYYMSQLNPATRFIFHFPLVGEWYPPEWRQENVDVLWAALPPYVLVLQVDYMPFVTGRDADSNTLLQEYNELNNWLIFNYEREAQIGNFFLWRRKTN